ncbi:MAG: lipoyl(octanoyl) transferase LipB [Fidelibacterota bacterium]
MTFNLSNIGSTIGLQDNIVPELSSDSLSKNRIQLEVLRLGRQSFESVWEMQKKLVKQRKEDSIPDSLILVEHEPVYTIGKNGDENHLLPSRDQDVPVYRIERGGDVTYHGPGQLVGYPILDLHNHRLSVSWYMRSLEEVLIRTLKSFKIRAERRQGLTGVWVSDNKIASLGVRLSRWITMHGFALNVNTQLDYFDGIIPCGLFECGVTSMEHLLGKKWAMGDIENRIEREFRSVFGLQTLKVETK